MRTTIRFGIAAAAALAFTPRALPCDPRSYDPKDDAPRFQVCDGDEQQGRPATAKDDQSKHAARAKDAAEQRDTAGAGSGEPLVREKHRSSPVDDHPHPSWTGP